MIDTGTITADWTLSTALGGAKVRVAPDDAVEARTLLAEPAFLADVEEPTEAERYSWTALIAATTAAWFPPLLLVAVWAIGRVLATADGETPRTRRRTGWAALFASPILIPLWLFTL